VKAFDGARAALQILLWLPGRLVVVLPFYQVCQAGLFVLIVDVENLLELPSLLDVSIIVAFDDTA